MSDSGDTGADDALTSPDEGDTGDHTPPNNDPPKPTEKLSQSYENVADPEILVTRIRDFYDDGVGAFEENRRLHSEDLNFVYNAETQGQWDPVVLQARQGKPCYTFNRVIGPVNMVVADMRQTRPVGEVRPTDDQGTQPVADIFGGLMRSIERGSRADQIYKTQYKFAVAGGFGAWRLAPEYAGANTFDQIIRIIDIPNPQTVVWDAQANDPCAGDANKCIVAERISLDVYHQKWPKGSGASLNFSRDSYGWFTDKEVRIADYYERVPFEKEIALMSDGTVVDYDDSVAEAEAHLEVSGLTQKNGVVRVVRRRNVTHWRVLWAKCDGSAILEGPIFYDWQRIPVVRCPGRYINIEGRKKLQSLIRHSKDAQRSYNSRVSDMIERSALIPKAPYLVTAKMIQGYEAAWQQANTQSRPFLPYNVDAESGKAGGPAVPTRTPPLDLPQGALALAQAAAGDIQATTGFFDPALGNSEDMNRVSGKALVQHTRRSDLGSFEFIDGFQAALQLTWEIGINMIPTVYDSKRIIQIEGQDGVSKMTQINHEQDDGSILNDLRKGSYLCTVTIGPSFQSQRQEALETLIEAAGVIPAMQQLAPDLIAKNIDNPDAPELTRRLRMGLIRQGIIQGTPAEMQEMPPPPKPDPAKVAELQREQALAARDQANAHLAQLKLNTHDLSMRKEILEVAGKHLANLLAAQKLGEPDAAAQAEDTSGQQPRS